MHHRNVGNSGTGVCHTSDLFVSSSFFLFDSVATYKKDVVPQKIADETSRMKFLEQKHLPGNSACDCFGGGENKCPPTGGGQRKNHGLILPTSFGLSQWANEFLGFLGTDRIQDQILRGEFLSMSPFQVPLIRLLSG